MVKTYTAESNLVYTKYLCGGITFEIYKLQRKHNVGFEKSTVNCKLCHFQK
jgi:hypothetical protein